MKRHLAILSVLVALKLAGGPDFAAAQQFNQYAGQVGGYDTIVSSNPAVTAGSYTTNYAIGGTQTVALFRTATQPSGVLNYVGVSSKGGYNTGITIYGFTHSLSSTCNDHAAFVLSNSDLPYLIPGFPITLTPAALNGTTQTVVSQSLVVSVANQDSTLDVDAYFCAVASSTTAPASTSDLEFTYAIVRD